MPARLPAGLLLGAVLLVSWLGAFAAERPNIAAASDLKFALEELATRFEGATGQAVALSFGSSGNLYRQIREGAPFELFLSADESFVRELVSAGLTRDAGLLYAIGRVALVAPSGSRLDVAQGLEGLRAALQAGQIRHFAIANPTHAPYGRAAEQTLRRAGLWAQIQPLLVLGENVSQATQFVLSGSADGGLVAHSLALAPPVQGQLDGMLVPEKFHDPLRQRMVLLQRAGPTAEQFYAYLQGPEARRILAENGFVAPESMP